MPLMWAHAEYIKLLRSLRDGQIFDLPPQTVQRYLVKKISAQYVIWRFSQKSREIPAGWKLRIELSQAAGIVWTADNWATNHTGETSHTNLGVEYFDIASESFPAGTVISFTFHWASGAWEGTNFEVRVV